MGSRTTADVLIIGAGIIGLACAVELAGTGRRVVLVDRHLPGAGQSTRTGGGIRLLHGTAVNTELTRRSLPTWERFADLTGIEPRYRRTGHLFLSGDDQGGAALAAQAAEQAALGVPVELLDAEAIGRRWPALATSRFTTGLHCDDGGWLDHHAVIDGYVAAARTRGVDIRPGARVDALLIDGPGSGGPGHDGSGGGTRVTGARTATGPVHAAQVVNAAGPSAGAIAAMAGRALPFVSRRHQLLVLDGRQDVPQDLPWLIDVDRQVHLRPDGDGRALVGGFLGHDDRTDPARWARDVDEGWSAEVRAVAAASFGVTSPDAAVVDGWAGLYPGTADYLPVLEVTRPGLVTAAGFSGTGLMHAPAVGRLVVDLVDGRPLDLPADLGGARFDRPSGPAERTGF